MGLLEAEAGGRETAPYVDGKEGKSLANEETDITTGAWLAVVREVVAAEAEEVDAGTWLVKVRKAAAAGAEEVDIEVGVVDERTLEALTLSLSNCRCLYVKSLLMYT